MTELPLAKLALLLAELKVPSLRRTALCLGTKMAITVLGRSAPSSHMQLLAGRIAVLKKNQTLPILNGLPLLQLSLALQIVCALLWSAPFSRGSSVMIQLVTYGH